MQRQQVSFSRLSLTDFKINVSRNAREKTIKKVWEDAGISAKWEATSWAKKAAARRNRAKTGDFERFKAMLANKKVRRRCLRCLFWAALVDSGGCCVLIRVAALWGRGR